MAIDEAIIVARAGTPEAASADYVCDGTNDQVEINAALAQAGAAGGGTVQLTSGTYSISSNVVAYADNITLKGAGGGQTILRAAANYAESTTPTGGRLGSMVTFFRADGFECRDLTVDGWANSIQSNGITCIESTGGVIEDCQSFIGAYHNYGIWALYSQNIDIRFNYVQGAPSFAQAHTAQVGIETLDSSNVTVANNTVRNIGGVGLYIEAATGMPYESRNIQFVDNDVDSSAWTFAAMAFAGNISDVVVRNNTLTNATHAGVFLRSLNGAPADPSVFDNIEVSSNYIRTKTPAQGAYADVASIHLWNESASGAALFSGINIADNEIVDPPSAGAAEAVRLLNFAGHAAFDDNTIFSSVDYLLDPPVQNLTLTGPAVAGTGNESANTITGNDQANVLKGEAGDDSLFGGLGADTLSGGSGSDRMRGGLGDDAYEITEFGDDVVENANEGQDSIATILDNYILPAYVEVLGAYGSAKSAYGNDLNNTLYGNEFSNVFYGLSGDDALLGAAGNDFLDGGLGNDVLLSGEAGDDAILGGAGNDLLRGGAGERDYLMGGATYDPAESGTGHDTLEGGEGVDVIHAADGNDRLFGGADVDYLLAGVGDDLLSGDAGDDFMFAGSEYVFDHAGAGNDVMRGGEGVDFMVGGQGNDTLDGEGGNDIVYGGSGDDRLSGGADNDSVLGDAGADLVAGGSGFDYLYGGAGADIFSYRRGDSYDSIFDFSAAQGDKLRIDPALGVTSIAQLLTVTTDNTVEGDPALTIDFITISGTVDQIIVFGLGPSGLNASTVEFV
jgi:Ca2+-binding RTX toxin-like protein